MALLSIGAIEALRTLLNIQYNIVEIIADKTIEIPNAIIKPNTFIFSAFFHFIFCTS